MRDALALSVVPELGRFKHRWGPRLLESWGDILRCNYRRTPWGRNAERPKESFLEGSILPDLESAGWGKNWFAFSHESNPLEGQMLSSYVTTSTSAAKRASAPSPSNGACVVGASDVVGEPVVASKTLKSSPSGYQARIIIRVN